MENLINQNFRQIIENGQHIPNVDYDIIDEKYIMPLIVNNFNGTYATVDFIKNTYIKIHEEGVKLVISCDSNNDGLVSVFNSLTKIGNVKAEATGISYSINTRITEISVTINNITSPTLRLPAKLDIDNFDEYFITNKIFKTFLLSKALGTTMIVDNGKSVNAAAITTMFSIFNLIMECPDDIDKNNTDWKKLYLMFSYTYGEEAVALYNDAIDQIPTEDFNSLMLQYIPLIEKIKPSLKADNFKDLSDSEKKLLVKNFLADNEITTPTDDPLLQHESRSSVTVVYVATHISAALLAGITIGGCFISTKQLEETILQTALAKVALGLSIAAFVEIAGCITAYFYSQNLEQKIQQNL